MYLHTRLLLGIAVVTSIALGVSVLVPLSSVRRDVSRETGASVQLARMLLNVQRRVDAAGGLERARAEAADDVRRAGSLRHVNVALVDTAGRLIAANPSDELQGGWIAKALAATISNSALAYPIAFEGTPLGELLIWSNPRSEIVEIEQRVERDMLLLALTIIAMALGIYAMVRIGLKPIGQIQAALTQLESGRLDARLPDFRLKDLNEIAHRFNRCASAMQASAAQHRALTRRLIHVEEQERKRLARELHDELGQSLTAIKVDAAYIAREAAGTAPKIEGCAQGIERIATDVMELIRNMLARLRPHGLETVGLRETLQELLSGWQQRVADRFVCSLAFEGPIDSLSADLNIAVYRLLQECLTNAVRHSRARTISIRVVVVERASGEPHGRVLLHVKESQVVGGAPDLSNGTGFSGMRERVEILGGRLQIGVLESGGMSLDAWMPVGA